MKANRAVVTLCVGQEAREYCSLSIPYMEKYAVKVGADFHVLSERKWPDQHSHLEKFQMYNAAWVYDRTLFVDGDVMISPGSPDIFDVAPMGQLAFMNECDHLAGQQKRNLGLIESLKKLSNKFKDGKGWQNTYFNSGVFLIEPRFAWLLSELPRGWSSDQVYLNLKIHEHGLPVFRLPVAFNYLPFHMGNDLKKAFAAYFIHATYPVHKWRVAAMKEIRSRFEQGK